MTKTPRKPRVIRLDQSGDNKPDSHGPDEPVRQRKPRAQKDLAKLALIPDEAAQASAQSGSDNIADALTPPPPDPSRKRFSFVNVLLVALAGLVSLGFGLTIDQLVRELFERNTWLGWAAALLTLAVVLAAIGIIVREFLGLRRMKQIEAMREKASELVKASDMRAAGRLVDQLMTIYQSRPDTARGRTKMESHHGEIIDGPDLIRLAECDLVSPLDKKARRLVLNAAKRVSVVTAISPRAIVDIAYVGLENIRLVRQLAELYGGRPGTLGMVRLARNVIAHLAVTGSIAIGDGIIQQLVGHGLAARLSSRLGEGVVNGLLTARVGISAIDLCRPLPFMAEKRPGISDFISDIVSISGGKEREDS